MARDCAPPPSSPYQSPPHIRSESSVLCWKFFQQLAKCERAGTQLTACWLAGGLPPPQQEALHLLGGWHRRNSRCFCCIYQPTDLQRHAGAAHSRSECLFSGVPDPVQQLRPAAAPLRAPRPSHRPASPTPQRAEGPFAPKMPFHALFKETSGGRIGKHAAGVVSQPALCDRFRGQSERFGRGLK